MMIEIKTFAAFTDYFPQQFCVEEPLRNVLDLRVLLGARNPEAEKLLNTARFAINHHFISENAEIEDGTIVYLIPPSGGG